MSDTTARPTVGFIGLGIMGRPMVRNLSAAGFELVVHNRSRQPVDDLVAELSGVSAGKSPADVTSRSDIVITMLPDTPDVEKVIGDEDGILGAIKPGQLVIDMSTISPDVTIALGERLREAGASLLDAPVSGGEKGAVDAVLSIMAGGSDADFARAEPLFAAMGKTIVHVGGPGAGQTVKMCNQIAVAINIAGVSEALMLGARAGVDPRKVAQVLAGGLAGSRGDGPEVTGDDRASVRAGVPGRAPPEGPAHRPRRRRSAQPVVAGRGAGDGVVRGARGHRWRHAGPLRARVGL